MTRRDIADGAEDVRPRPLNKAGLGWCWLIAVEDARSGLDQALADGELDQRGRGVDVQRLHHAVLVKGDGSG